MEQLLIVEDDIGLNQGLCKALKADARQIISCQDLKTAKEQLLCGSVSLILRYMIQSLVVKFSRLLLPEVLTGSGV